MDESNNVFHFDIAQLVVSVGTYKVRDITDQIQDKLQKQSTA